MEHIDDKTDTDVAARKAEIAQRVAEVAAFLHERRTELQLAAAVRIACPKRKVAYNS